jgi:putative salt-induced outer membrane protein YdiY
VSRLDAVFLATVFRWDPFAGIDRRNQGQIGYLRYFIREAKHRVWGEIGYDLTSDNYGPVEGKPDAALPPDENALIHSARLFAGYDNQLNAALTYLGGLEALFNVEQSKDVRLNFSNALRSAIAGNFSLELKLTLAFDNVPATSDAKKLDTTLLINLLYQLL